MEYNINDIMPYVKNFNFDRDYFSTMEEDLLISSVDENAPEFDWEDGASKLVIIPNDKNYVIKIPFNAGCSPNEDMNDMEYYDFSQNYCETEVDLYNKIMDENPLFAQFFLPLTRVEEFKEYSVYVQPKCSTYLKSKDDEIKSSYSAESLNKVTFANLDYKSSIPEDWVAGVLEILKDINLVQEFFDFLYKYDIMFDLHRGNIGYCNNRPIILDYAGFYEQDSLGSFDSSNQE